MKSYKCKNSQCAKKCTVVILLWYHKYRSIIFLLGEDDPFSRPEWVPVDEIKKSKNVAFITTKEGGHVGFFQNSDTKFTYSEEVSLDFIKCVSELKKY